MQVNYSPRKFPAFSQLGQEGIGGVLPSGSQPQATPTVEDQDPNAYDLTDMDPLSMRQSLAADALREGSSTAPAAGWTGGLARLAQAVAGGYSLHGANEAIKDAKKHNVGVMEKAVNQGDWSKLATSDSAQASKLGDMLLQAKLKNMPTERLMTTPEIKSAGLPDGTVATVSRTGEMKILNRPSTGVPKDYHYVTGPDGEQVLTYIIGGPADPAVIAKDATSRRKPSATVDNTGKAPWEMKW